MWLPVITYPVIDPVLIDIGPVPIRWYALAYIAGLILGWAYAGWLVQQDRLWGGLPLAAPLRVAVRVVYFDMHGGGFNVTVDASGECATVGHVDVGNSGAWLNVTLPLLAAPGAFGRKCGAAGGADITIVSTSVADTIFAQVEVYKV